MYPMRTSTGEPAGYVGVDIQMTDVMNDLQRFARQMILLMAALTLVISLLLIRIASKTMAEPIKRLSSAAEKLVKEQSGKGIAANAGHEHPALCRANGRYELVEYRHSPAVATMEGIRFREHTFELRPGDRLFVYTDGVTEATSMSGELFGTERMLAALNSDPGAAPELTVEAADENLARVLAFVDEQLDGVDCPSKTRMQIDIAVEELLVNIAHYAYAPGTGQATVRVELSPAKDRAAITFLDRGVPYDPLAKPDPDVTLPAEERQIGGLGIYMVKKSMDEMKYEYRDGQNVLTIQKTLA